MRRFSQRLESLSSGTVAVAATVIFVAFMLVVLPAQAEHSEELFGDVDSPDGSFYYTADDTHGWPAAYGLFLVTTIASPASMLKWTFVGGSFVALLAGGIVWAAGAFRRRGHDRIR